MVLSSKDEDRLTRSIFKGEIRDTIISGSFSVKILKYNFYLLKTFLAAEIICFQIVSLLPQAENFCLF